MLRKHATAGLEKTRSTEAWHRIDHFNRLSAKQPSCHRETKGYVANMQKLHNAHPLIETLSYQGEPGVASHVSAIAPEGQ